MVDTIIAMAMTAVMIGLVVAAFWLRNVEWEE